MKAEVFFREFPKLETKRLVLREMKPQDNEAIFSIFSRPEVTNYYDQETFQTIDPAKKFVDSCIKRFYDRRGIRWGIAIKGDSNIIGTCGLHNIAEKYGRAEIGYDLAPIYWGKGIMSEAIHEILRFCFEDVLFNRIEALCMQGNTRSVSLLKKLKFQEEGILRQYAFWKNHHHDLTILSLLKHEYEKA